MRKRTKIILISLASVLVCIIAAVFIYFSIYYKAVDVESYLNSDDNVSVEKIKDGFFFDSSENDKALIFYPGAKVDTKAYAPLCHEIAKSGYDVFLIDMPFHFAIFGVNKAVRLLKIIIMNPIILQVIVLEGRWQLIMLIKMQVN